MFNRALVAGMVIVLSLAAHASAVQFTIEPDDYAEGAALTSVAPGITLRTMLEDDTIVDLFTVTAARPAPAAPTGELAFAHAGVPFWVDVRRLRIDLAAPASQIALSFAGGTHFDTDHGKMEIYNAAGLLLDTYLTAPKAYGEVEVMTLTRPTADIAYAIAWSVPGDGPYGPFGVLDHLVVDVVPEPATAMLMAAAVLAAFGRRRRPAGL